MERFPHACLVILDGFGIAEPGPGNAVLLAKKPVFDSLWERYPHAQLLACGEHVGLPPGQMGNSEVGHLNLGAGAVVPQDLARIDQAVLDGSLVANETLNALVEGVERVHLIGLVSDGGVHSADRHLRALVQWGAAKGIPDLVIHAFTDGRDTSPTGGADFIAEVEGWCRDAGAGRVGSVIGRYYAMDRDKRWDRVQQAYDLLVHGRAEYRAPTGEAAARAAYEREETDEFIGATTVGGEAHIRPGDAVLGFNFRPDRMREITLALADPAFGQIDRGGAAVIERYATMTVYDESWSYPILFPEQRPTMTMAKVIAGLHLKQLHVAETEKYPHVTYFFNGGVEEPYAGERRELAPSPRDVPTYDHKPEMSAVEATDRFVRAFEEDEPTFAIINFANPDMVGHTGVIPAAVKAVETVDACLGRVVEAVQAKGGALVITADHGNCDHMLNEDGSPNTAHSLNPVPYIVTVEGIKLREQGILADVTPTLLELLDIPQPPEMTGASMILGA